MANLSPLSFAQVQQNAIAAYNGKSAKPANTGANSALGPIFNANALEFSGLQWQLLYLNSISRLQTCTTVADAATYIQPFGLVPGAAVAAQGDAKFSTTGNVPATQQIPIYPGTIVQTSDGTQFQVIEDDSQPGWSPSLGAYVIAASGTSVIATVQALVAGTGGNVLAQTITQIVSSAANPAPSGVGVLNAAAFTNGADEESLSAFIDRFQAFITSRWGVDDAIAATVTGVQTGLTYTIGDGVNADGSAASNFFTVVVNEINQSAGPSSSLLASVSSAVLADRACGMPFQVVGPTLITVNGAVTLQLLAGADAATVSAAAQTAYANYLNNIGLGNNVVFADTVASSSTRASYNALVALLVAIPGVASVPDPPGLTLNGGTVDIVASWGSMIVAGSLTVLTQ